MNAPYRKSSAEALCLTNAFPAERLAVVALAVSLAISAPAPLAAQTAEIPLRLQVLSKQLPAIAAELRQSVVGIVVHVSKSTPGETPLRDPFASFDHPQAGQLPARIGIGAVLQKTSQHVLILTLAHLVEPAAQPGEQPLPAQIFVRTAAGHTASATIVGADPRSDLAVLSIPVADIAGNGGKMKAVAFPADQQIQPGELLIAAGNPWEIVRDGSASVGIGLVTNTGRPQAISSPQPLMERTLHDLGTLVELDLARQLSHSGTVLATMDGKFAGLVTALANPSGTLNEMSYAIPMSVGMQRIIKDLQQGYEVEYGFLGISLETSLPEDIASLELGDEQPTAGLVTRVSTNSPAERAGIQREDLILRVNDSIIRNSEDLVREVGLIEPGNAVEILLFRRNRGLQTVKVRLGKWPVYDDTQLITSNLRYPAWRGLHVDFSTGRRRYLHDRFLTTFPAGVVISHVEEGSLAAQAGLQVGQFIRKVSGQTVETPAEFHHTADNETENVRLLLGNGSEVTIPAEDARPQ